MSSKSMRTVPEYRSHTGPPGFAEKPVCTETPLCEGCPFPSHGFLCQGGDGECMRTRLMKLSEKEKADDCSSQSEFIEKAIHFYIGYISSENGSDYLPKIITSTVKGIVNDSDNRISRILFKLAVEQAITMNVVAAACNIGREQLEKLRDTCVAQVKRSNGVYSFEDAFDFQKR